MDRFLTKVGFYTAGALTSIVGFIALVLLALVF